MSRWNNFSIYKKPLLIFSSAFLLLAIIIILTISPITKYLIEKYDEKYTGRQITLDWAYVNPFNGFIHLKDFKIFESKSDSIFFSADDVSINITLLKLLSSTYEISNITLIRPKGNIIQDKNELNFNDLIHLFSSKKDSTKINEPLKLNILNLKIIDGEFYYHEKTIPINYFIKNVDFESAGKQWNIDTVNADFSFQSGIGKGEIKGNLTINVKKLDYRYAVIVHQFDLNIIEQYLKDLTNYGTFHAILDAEIKSAGNFTDQEDVTTIGIFAISNFHFGKNRYDDYLSFDTLAVSITELSPKKLIYNYKSVILSHPYFKYERYDYLDNLQTMFGRNGTNYTSKHGTADRFNLVIEIANYIKVLSRNFFQSQYKINRLAINNGDLKFNDYSKSEKFTLSLSPLNVSADSIDKNNKRANISFYSGIKPYGKVSADLSINPKDSGDFDLKYNLQKVPVSAFNPYIISYTSYALDRGTIESNGTWHVREGIIQSNNHLLIMDARATKKAKNKDLKWIPLPIIMSLIRDRGNVIDYDIPITGNLKNPKFHFKDAVFDLLENIFVKPATTPYRIQVKNVETEIEKSLTLIWEMRSSTLQNKQEKFLKRMAEFLSANPDASITVSPQIYAVKEKEYISFFEAKKAYFLSANNKQTLNPSDSEKVEKMSIKDSLFLQYLNNHIKDTMVFTIQEKCLRLFDPSFMNSKFRQLNDDREHSFKSFFKERNVEKQVKLVVFENMVPYNGFSYYKIAYNGQFPESLLKAYRQMNELNDETPRKKFKLKRRKANAD